uniref:Uncharacterized protein n=1 Tax=Bacteriophage sp. TaxID=38018 RepID=A0A8D9PEX9_9VIRU|nr:MAG TPA: hypothetical protein [Bacteriophage sp.]
MGHNLKSNNLFLLHFREDFSAILNLSRTNLASELFCSDFGKYDNLKKQRDYIFPALLSSLILTYYANSTNTIPKLNRIRQ